MATKLRTDIDWDFILDTIREKKCIILLGPEVARTPEGASFRDAFLETLDIPNNKHILTYYENDDFFLFNDARSKSRIHYSMKSFYQEQKVDRTPYRILARLPLRLYINASPDRFLNSEMGQDIPHIFDFFHKTAARPETSPPSDEIPVVYNMTGVLEEEESLILTHDDLYDYLEGVLATRKLPQNLLNELCSSRSLIFLGFSFEKWYVQLMLRLLRVHDDRSKFVRYATHEKFKPETISLCKDQFKMEFVGDNIFEFLKSLEQKCEERGLLRELNDDESTADQMVLHFIEQNDFDKAINLLKDYFQPIDEDLYSEVIGISSRYNRLRKRINQNVLSKEDAEIELSKVRHSLIDMTKEMDL